MWCITQHFLLKNSLCIRKEWCVKILSYGSRIVATCIWKPKPTWERQPSWNWVDASCFFSLFIPTDSSRLAWSSSSSCGKILTDISQQNSTITTERDLKGQTLHLSLISVDVVSPMDLPPSCFILTDRMDEYLFSLVIQPCVTPAHAETTPEVQKSMLHSHTTLWS